MALGPPSLEVKLAGRRREELWTVVGIGLDRVIGFCLLASYHLLLGPSNFLAFPPLISSLSLSPSERDFSSLLSLVRFNLVKHA